MMRIRKRPVVVDAEPIHERIEIETLEGVMVGEPGDLLITGVAGEKYPCKPSIAVRTYEPDGDLASEEWAKWREAYCPDDE